jgi:hypothetical protein
MSYAASRKSLHGVKVKRFIPDWGMLHGFENETVVSINTFCVISRLSGSSDPVIKKFCLNGPEILDRMMFSSHRGSVLVPENLFTV